MYTCSTCGKEYTRQTSLARHMHNHARTNPHICTQCDVVFYRRDLLSRHLKSHQDGAHSTNKSVSRYENRKRCHTACARCRNLKIKCSGNSPCVSCSKAEVRCQYLGSRNRISHRVEDHSVDTVPDAEMTSPQSSQDSAAHDSSENGVASPRDDPGQSLDVSMISEPDSGALSSLDHFDCSMRVVTTTNLMDFESQTIPASTDVQSLLDPFQFSTWSWPWHHENSFLQDPDLAFHVPNTFLTSGETYDNPSHDDFPVPSLLSHAQAAPPQTENTTTSPREATVPHVNPPAPLEEDQQARIIDELAKFASACRGNNATHDYSPYWTSISPKVAQAFYIDYWPGKGDLHLLEHFVNLYFRYFEPLWPFFSTQDLEPTRLHPLLYLVLMSIGAMYGDASAGSFGMQLHVRVRACLCEPIELEHAEQDSVWLAQARCHTRVAALYFGQMKAISYANHLGTLLVAQARRLELFHAPYVEASMQEFRDSANRLSDQDRLNIWLRLEARRRIAFAIYRSEAYTSLLLQTKPLIYLGEIDLAFPSCDMVFGGKVLSPSVCLYLIENDSTPGKDLLASDLYRIALDKDEPLPPLGPVAWELLSLGLIWPVWEFSRDQTMLGRLTNGEFDLPIADGVKPDEQTTSSPLVVVDTESNKEKRTEHEHVESIPRKMSNLRYDYERIIQALCKLERLIPVAKSLASSNRERYFVMSGLIVYHLIHLRLNSPIADLHQIQHKQLQKPSADSSCPSLISQWLKSRRAYHAAKRAVSIWSLIAGECAKPTEQRRPFNLVAFTGLHDAAVLLWAYSSTVRTPFDEPPLVLRIKDGEFNQELPITQSNSRNVVRSFGNLYEALSPGRWSSFAAATNSLVDIPFPSPKR